MRWLRTWLLVTLSACAAAPERESDAAPQLPGYLKEILREPAPALELTDAVVPDDSPDFRRALQFDRFLKGELPDAERTALQGDCARKSRNPFCPLVRERKGLLAFLEKREREPVYRGSVEPVTLPPQFEGGRVTNWARLRRADVDKLLPGLHGLEPEKLEILRQRALAEGLCPNHVAIAVAATLEDGMPNRVDPKHIAALYLKGGRCFPRKSAHRENYYTRAGLLYYYARDYRAAAEALEPLYPSDALVGRPLYWQYRARRAMGDSTGAGKALTRLIERFPLSFHALVAALENHQAPETLFLGPATEPRTRSRRDAATNRRLEAVERLARYGFRRSAARLARWTDHRSRRLEPEVRLHLASFGDPNFRVEAMTDLFIRRPRLMSADSQKLAHPIAYREWMEKASGGVDPLLLMAIGRKESKFNPRVISPANARGLLQIHPDTAAKMTNGAEVDLFHVGVNIALGARHVADLMKELDGRLPWVIAAYNAGKDATLSWLRRFPHSDTVLQIDLITYRETRNYVGFVLANYYWYRTLYEPGKGSPFGDWLKPEVARATRSLETAEAEADPEADAAPEAAPEPTPPPDSSPAP